MLRIKYLSLRPRSFILESIKILISWLLRQPVPYGIENLKNFGTDSQRYHLNLLQTEDGHKETIADNYEHVVHRCVKTQMYGLYQTS